MKKHKMKKVLVNPLDEFTGHFPPRGEHFTFPFLHSIQTNDERRVYTFRPSAKELFQIVVEFPLPDYGEITVEIAGEKINPDKLRAAITLVEKNEMSFNVALEESGDVLLPRNTQISEKAFKKLGNREN